MVEIYWRHLFPLDPWGNRTKKVYGRMWYIFAEPKFTYKLSKKRAPFEDLNVNSGDGLFTLDLHTPL